MGWKKEFMKKRETKECDEEKGLKKEVMWIKWINITLQKKAFMLQTKGLHIIANAFILNERYM